MLTSRLLFPLVGRISLNKYAFALASIRNNSLLSSGIKPLCQLTKTPCDLQVSYRCSAISQSLPDESTNDDIKANDSQSRTEAMSHSKLLFNSLKQLTISKLLKEAERLITNHEEASIFMNIFSSKLSNLRLNDNDLNITLTSMAVFETAGFKHVTSFFENNKQITDHQWVLWLLYLLRLPFCSTSTHLINNAETELLSRSEGLSVTTLIKLTTVYRDQALFWESDHVRDKTACEKFIHVLETKCIHVNKPKQLISILYILVQEENEETFKVIEKRATDLIDKFSYNDMVKLLSLLAVKKRRNTVLIQSLVTRLNSMYLSDASFVSLLRLLEAISSLNIFNSPLLEKICKQLKEDYIFNDYIAILPRNISTILTCLARLRWKDLGLIDGCWTRMQFGVMDQPLDRFGKLQATVRALGKLNYTGNDTISLQLENMASNAVVPDFNGKGNVVSWLNFVWWLVVLKKATSVQVSSVLDPVFTSLLKSFKGMDLNSFESQICYQKLQNIDTAAKYEMVNYTGHTLEEQYLYQLPYEILSHDRQSYKLLLRALSRIVGSNKQVTLNKTPGGYLIDALIHVNNDGTICEVSQDKPSDLHRVCIKVQNFSDTIFVTKGPSGPFEMMKRHLNLMDYKVITVPYELFSGQPAIVEISKYISDGIMDVLQK